MLYPHMPQPLIENGRHKNEFVNIKEVSKSRIGTNMGNFLFSKQMKKVWKRFKSRTVYPAKIDIFQGSVQIFR